jgi:hypothetical protein
MANVTASKTTVGNSIAVNAGDIKVRELIIRAVDIVNAGTYATDDTVTFTIPVNAGEAVVAAGASLTEAFDGSGDQLNMTVGDGADADGYLASAALHTSQTEISTVYSTGDLLDGTTSYFKAYTADDTIDILLDGTAGAAIDLDDLTAGSVKVKIFYHDVT